MLPGGGRPGEGSLPSVLGVITHRDVGDITMTQTKDHPALNGVDVPTLFATLDAVKGAPEIAAFQFRARNTWVSGTHNRTTIQGFYGAGQEDTTRAEPFTYDADHPAVLVESGKAPTPAEFFFRHDFAAADEAAAEARRRIGLGVSEDRRLFDLVGLQGLLAHHRGGGSSVFAWSSATG
jgi:hypothetical protein